MDWLGLAVWSSNLAKTCLVYARAVQALIHKLGASGLNFTRLWKSGRSKCAVLTPETDRAAAARW